MLRPYALLGLMLFGAAATAQTTTVDDGPLVWQEARLCRELDLLGKIPRVIARLHAFRSKQPAEAARCEHTIALLYERLGDFERTVHHLRRAMTGDDAATARRATLDFARMAPRTGAYAEAERALRRLTRDDALPAAEASLGLARLSLAAGDTAEAMRMCVQARARLTEVPTDSQERLRYEASWIEGRALERRGLTAAALERFWLHFVADAQGCARDARIPRAVERIHRERGDLESLKSALTAETRRAGVFSSFGTLLEYVDLLDLIERGNTLGLLAELEGIDPPLWNDLDGGDWHYFAAARALVSRHPGKAREAVIGHMARTGYFTFGAYVLGLVGDRPSLDHLFRLAIAATSVRDLKNITTAIARSGQGARAERLLRQLLSVPTAARPRQLKDAVTFALQYLPTDA